MRRTNNIGLLALGLASSIKGISAGLTWPSAYDEIEDIMFLNNGYNAREFPILLQPCTIVKEPGHSIAAGLIRTAFHDMAPHDASTGIGGVDASIGFELDSNIYPTNTGIAFNNTMHFYSQFFNSRAPMADLVNVGLYQAVRACGGPVVPVRAGRVDATGPGPVGVPQPTDQMPKMIGEFRRMGFSPEEMVAMVACGHSIGGVHSAEHPDIVPPYSTPLGVQDLDYTNATFDNAVVTEYLDGTTKNPLVVGANPAAYSDGRIFGLNKRQTVSALADPNAYASTCSGILARMVNTVPAGVQLSDAIAPYDLKPSNLQLNVAADGQNLEFTGELRIHTNSLPSSSIASVQVVYKDRTGASNNGRTIAASALGDANGFDDTFTFYGFEGTIPAMTSISSFTVVATLTSGSTQSFDNNGQGYPISDKIFAQTSYSSLAATDGSGNQQLTVFAAVRTGETSEPVTLSVDLINPITYNNLPTVSTVPTPMTNVCAGQYYTFYSATFGVPAAGANFTKYDVTTSSNGATVSDSFKNLAGLPVTASTAPSCGAASSKRAINFSA
ncbi:uncharacterized protein A1O5_04637 [Cladophialophora psammophila CBS 110553]|uniref:Peroxidase n=1 Tax=Cladophialophora psammophila CBS 110553 TaxID=1182543 RepID=W9WW01_9EURO|nr:uncharacterized protein A1O5_04637 [Cladophialophora psammophila CBS 110553]EXJ72133.1 hypothetical protein A1O5_04637 [Cladophialophora psammophila CBS 110553]